MAKENRISTSRARCVCNSAVDMTLRGLLLRSGVNWMAS
jgi:hypothetical protein